jgi:hypothetical protein
MGSRPLTEGIDEGAADGAAKLAKNLSVWLSDKSIVSWEPQVGIDGDAEANWKQEKLKQRNANPDECKYMT